MKRFLCLCLAFCMMLSLFPVGAFAEEDVSLTEFGMEQLSLQEQAFIPQEQTEQPAAEELPLDATGISEEAFTEAAVEGGEESPAAEELPSDVTEVSEEEASETDEE